MPGIPRIRSLRNRFLVFSQLIVAALVVYNRVYLHYHTMTQVVAGAFVGTALGCVWYYFINYYFTKYVPFIIEHPFEKYLFIRDYAPIPHLIHFQYENEYAEAKTTIGNSNDNNNNNNNNNHKRQWSEGTMVTDKSMRLYKDDDRQLIQSLVNEYLLEGSNDVLDLIRNCPNECFE
ncbi:unnamed protein product, partial [Rotaria sordida]